MSVYTANTDQELLCLLLENDEGAFNEIYHRYWKMLFSTACSRLRNKEDAREVVQQVFFMLWKHRTRLQILHLRNYLSAMTRHAVYRYIATYGRETRPLPHDLTVTDTDEAERRQIIRLLEKFADTLPPAQRTLFIACKLRDQPLKEVADNMGLPLRTAEGYIAKTLKLLRRQVAGNRFLSFIWFCSSFSSALINC
ncbi:sigma-70 family RNA polymerase sigma factor [Nostoc ellipsosporum NOK]|nr:sigma-70 family RNA polymerase sigma factor [Nostoc ellipsosporum NOK]